MMKSALYFCTLVACLSIPVREVQACSCLSTTLEDQLVIADYAFAGTVLRVDTVRSHPSSPLFLVATVAVEEVWKGDVPAEFQVWTLSSSASCGYNDPWARFEIAEKFVLYAFDPSFGMENVFTILCTRNKKYHEAGDDLAILGPGDRPISPDGFTLGTPHPHPTATETLLSLSVDRAQHIRVEVFDVQGRQVATVHDGPLPADSHRALPLDLGPLPAGLYIVRATGDGSRQVQRVVVVR